MNNGVSLRFPVFIVFLILIVLLPPPVHRHSLQRYNPKISSIKSLPFFFFFLILPPELAVSFDPAAE